MKEKLPNIDTGHERLSDTHEAAEPRREVQQPNVEATEAHNHNIDKLQESIHEAALSSEEVDIEQPDTRDQSQPPVGLQRELKRDAYTKTLRKVQGQLAPIERTLSKVIHHRAIEPISEVGSKTIGRPSGVLGGGITALLGSTTVLIMAKYYGFEYKLSLFFILLGLGFFVGISIELAVYLLRRKKT